MKLQAALLTTAIAAALSAPSMASTVTFDFNNVAGVTHTTNCASNLGGTGTSTQIATSMNSALGAGASVVVAGATASNSYTGECHVNGVSLGTSDGGAAHVGSYDTFIMNDSFGGHASSGGAATDRFTLTFSGFTIFSLSFDWEIFPNASCAAGSTCANSHGSNAAWPDLTVMAGANQIFHAVAGTPGSSPNDPQAIGTSGLIAIAGGATTLTFIDWPAEIGIDNLVINGCRIREANCGGGGGGGGGNVPEPATLPLAGLALASLMAARRRKAK